MAGDLSAVERSTPGLNLADLSGRTVALGDFSGRDVVVHFFASWCEPCRDELPALQRLAAREPRLAVVAIAVADIPIRVRRLLAEVPVDFPVLLDPDRATAKAWGVSTLPTSFVLSADHARRRVIEQEYDWDHFDPAQTSRRATEETK